MIDDTEVVADSYGKEVWLREGVDGIGSGPKRGRP